MADIAILVAEEYERRVKNSRKGDKEMINFSPSCLYELAHGFKNKVMKQPVRDESNVAGIVNLVLLEPKTQMSLAASHGFFSA